MRNTKAAARYAKSLMELSIEQGKLDRCLEDMQLVEAVLDDSKELRAVLKSPVIKADKKMSILEEIFGAKLDKLSIEFLRIVGEKGRDAILVEIVESFVEQVKHHKHIMVAKVVTATPMTDANREKIKAIIEKVHNGELEIIEEVDKNIIGGFILNIADKRIDASVAGKIRELKKEFENNPYESQL